MPDQKSMLHVALSDDLIHQIADFQHERRFRSRGAAVEWLIEEGLRAAEIEGIRCDVHKGDFRSMLTRLQKIVTRDGVPGAGA